MALLIDGKRISAEIKDELKGNINSYKETPVLAVITIGKYNEKFVNNKKKACEYIGMSFLHISFDESVKEEKVIKRIKELNKEKARAKVLKQEQKNKQAEYDKLKQQLDDYQEKEEQQKQEAEQARRKAEAAAKKEAEARQKEAEEQQKAAQRQEANTNSSSSSSNSSNQGDLYTGNQGTIVGNSNSKIYHVPGQAGYHMNSANAVYFNSEQDAINAGYRKAKR